MRSRPRRALAKALACCILNLFSSKNVLVSQSLEHQRQE
jgi:hypothetical protein